MKKIILTLCAALILINLYSQESMRRWRKTNQIRLDKYDLILPEVMRENKIDMWIIMNREGNFDPLYAEMGEGYVGHTGYYILPIRVSHA